MQARTTESWGIRRSFRKDRFRPFRIRRPLRIESGNYGTTEYNSKRTAVKSRVRQKKVAGLRSQEQASQIDIASRFLTPETRPLTPEA